MIFSLRLALSEQSTNMGAEIKIFNISYPMSLPVAPEVKTSTPLLAIFSLCGDITSKVSSGPNEEIWTFRIQFSKPIPMVRESKSYKEYHSAIQEWVNTQCEFHELDRIKVPFEGTLNYKFDDQRRISLSNEANNAFAMTNGMNLIDLMGASLCTSHEDLEPVVYVFSY